MNDQRIATLTDSGTDTPAAFCAAHDVRVIPLSINYRDGTYLAGVDITTEEVIRRFAEEVPTTSLPSPEAIRKAFERARGDGYEKAVFVSISSALSATNETVRLVGRSMEAEGFPVLVVDTKSIGIGAGLTVMAAARMVEAGVPFERLGARLGRLVSDSSVFFCTKTLAYLRKGGRITEATYRLGSVLNIKPIITCDASGAYVTAKKARGWEKALSLEVALVKAKAERFDRVIIGICCSDSESIFDWIEARVREQISGIVEVVRTGVSPDLTVHTGPDLVGITVQPALEPSA